MKSLVLFSALCSVALGSHWAGVPGVPHDTPAVAAARAAHLAAHAAAAHGHVGVGALGVAGLGAAGLGGWGGHGYAGGWAHGAAPLGPNGVVVDTPEVAAAKAQHLHAVAHAGNGAWNGGAWNGGAWNGGAWNGGAWNGGAWDDGSWHGDNGQWNGDNGGVWAGHDNGQWHGEGVLDGAAFAGAGAYGAGAYGAGAYGALNNGQWSAHLWGDKSGHGHRWRRSLLHGAVIAPAVPLAHTVAVAPALGHVAVGHLGVGHLGLGHLGLGHGLIHG